MDKNIIRLDVSMDDILNMHVFKPIANLLYNGGHNFLRNFSPVESLCYTTIAHVLHNQVNKLFIVEKSVQVRNVSMKQKWLDLYLSHDQFLSILLLYFLFW